MPALQDPDAVQDFSGNPFVRALAAPIAQVQGTVGPGTFDGDTDPAQFLQGAMDSMTGVLNAGLQAGQQLIGAWSGAAAQALGGFAGAAAQALAGLAARSGQMGATVGQASESTSRAAALLSAIMAQFESISSALEPLLIFPGVAGVLAEEAERHLSWAIETVSQLEAELGAHAATMTGPMMADIAQPATPVSGAVQPMMSAVQSGIQAGTSALQSIGHGATQAMSTIGGEFGKLPQGFTGLLGGAGAAGFAGAPANPFPPNDAPRADAGHPGTATALLDPRSMGQGTQLFLPDGSASQAPNAVAASAVRHALSQVGVPYEWGGTTPGVGLDCSGLTQWAYREAGLNLPRLAQDQDVGAPVGSGGVLPGDLAVWDGHVAMVIGNGMMVEAGDPVQISPIRTTNAGQGFHGFFRPTS